eukprot:9121236-Lingulodinium_polyedra.AAC.1
MTTRHRRLLRAMAFRMFSRVTGWPPSSSLFVSPPQEIDVGLQVLVESVLARATDEGLEPVTAGQ